MLVTQGVNLKELKPEIIRVIPVLKSVFEQNGKQVHIIKGFVETNDMGRYHACGLAIDFNCGLVREDSVINGIRSLLGDEYIIVSFSAYFHLAFIGTVNFYKPDGYEDAFNHITKGAKLYGRS